MSKKQVIIYTDGACSGNPGLGGWGAYLIYQDAMNTHTKSFSGAFENTTNNQMELQAIIYALEKLKQPCQVQLFTDSKYVLNGITKWIQTWQKNNWKNSNKKSVKNQQLWQKLLEISARHDMHWHWVKGHSGIQGNEKADQLAQQAILKHRQTHAH